MALPRRLFFPLVAVTLTASILLAGIAQAANSRFVQVNGDALLGDDGKITIETFNKPDMTGPRSGGNGGSLNVLTPVSCTITGPSNCVQTAAKLRDSLDVQLPPTFIATLVGGGSSVQIDYTDPGAFNFTMLSDDIPRQSVMEVDAGAIPTLSEWGVIILSLLLLVSGAWYLRRRRLAGSWGSV